MRKLKICLLIITALLSLYFTPAPPLFNKVVAGYYDTQLDSLQTDLEHFDLAVKRHASNSILRTRFLTCRDRYKKISFFTEQLDTRNARLLNGPDLLRIEDDTQNDSTRPHGFQHIESILYVRNPDTALLRQEIRFQTGSVIRLRQAPDHEYSFRDDRVWESLRSGVYRIISLGITGFDVPVALTALPETKTQLAAMRLVISFYQSDIESRDKHLYRATVSAFDKAILAISPSADFEMFDRLSFIKNCLNPLSAKLRDCAVVMGVINHQQLTPLNPEADNLFAPDIFNMAFFSPNERYTVTPERAALGRRLFFEKKLSAGNIRSCATCHQPQRAFTDGELKAIAIAGNTALMRNTPTLWNSALQARQFYDSRALVLETQLSGVVHSRSEMGGSLSDAARVLAADPAYPKLFEMAYPADKGRITQYTIANAISSYIRTLLSFNSPFDRYIRGQNETYSVAARHGFNLFMGKAKCGTCHYAPLFNGLVPPRYEESESEILGVPANSLKNHAVLDADKGKFYATGVPLHQYAFKTPGIRNIALTAPYMHNGVFATLAAVIDFYDNGGGVGRGIQLETQTLPTDKLHLSKNEKADLILFLRSLTDTASACLPGIRE